MSSRLLPGIEAHQDIVTTLDLDQAGFWTFLGVLEGHNAIEKSGESSKRLPKLVDVFAVNKLESQDAYSFWNSMSCCKLRDLDF